MILLLPILILVGLCCYGLMKQQVPLAQSLTILCYIFLFFLFLIGVAIDVHPYDKAIDPIDNGYEFIAKQYSLIYLASDNIDNMKPGMSLQW